MADVVDTTPHWARELTHLRARARKLRWQTADPLVGELTDEALATCDSVLRDLAGAQLECDRLRSRVRMGNADWNRLFDAMPGACLLTDNVGLILNANKAAGVLLNVSPKWLKDRQL